MVVTALCFYFIGLLMLFPLCTHVQTLVVSDSVFIRVEPNRLQFFEYEHVTFQCEGSNDSTGLKIVHQTKRNLTSCNTKTTTETTVLSCTVQSVYHEDSGEYWCESGGVKRSNSINITVTAGSVILESPVLPVTEGEAVTLRCRNKTTSTNPSAEFYKDGILIRNSSTGEMTIHSTCKCDKGLYKCRNSGGEESAESWLKVKAGNSTFSGDPAPTCPSNSVLIVFSVLLALLCVVGLLHLGKGYWHRVSLNLPIPPFPSSESPTVPVEARVPDTARDLYAVVPKSRELKADNRGLSSGALYYTLDDTTDTQQQEPGVSNTTATAGYSSGTSRPLTQDSFYSIIQQVEE
ncbi:low affinity immunoglobulin gamma Fc region receptor II-b-like isoform X2 [Notolabrus celidotus]|uniref:low affinity immunoglobulin gamma Fc region receptor II-b-like isoform X2 n=1 Tax=Notolabrus celidotus TaxID=1203425 RepID=UPI0014901A59|nr:low affinity immunoglobulin gamma Fc region receptor II-b-like isoform X2 [Notolabrus celidotus]